jgi:hypothetical protein
VGVVLEVWEPVSPGLVLYTGQQCCLVMSGGKYMPLTCSELVLHRGQS